MSKNQNLNKAKQNKNDEFYTNKQTIENELKWYEKHFKDKIILMNCDDPVLIKNFKVNTKFQQELSTGIENKNSKSIKDTFDFYQKTEKVLYETNASQFWVFFHKSFKRLGLKKIIASHYDKYNQTSYYIEYDGNGDDFNIFDFKIHFFNESNGDFRSKECIELLKQSDLIITNPPFSLFNEFIKTIFKYQKDFLIIGDILKYKNAELFPLIKNNQMWLGNTTPKEFIVITDNQEIKTQKFGKSCWYTNLISKKKNEFYNLTYSYKNNESHYPKYENYDAINVDKSKEIPKDYPGVIGVPISFLLNLSPKQFEIIGLLSQPKIKSSDGEIKSIYTRLLIQKK